jgi:2-keto-4-pentenoate hydratase/2-oxohepta-3-ene-1,7-dioic acid hydratase in catechol pathway
VAEAHATCGAGAPLLGGLDEALQDWARAAPDLARAARAVAAAADEGRLRPLAPGAYRLCAPFVPARIFAAASNYREHAAEMGTQLAARSESEPYHFLKAETSVNDPGAAVVMPAGTQKLDWEVELGVVLGRGGRHIAVERALEHVAGYVVFNDVSARDLNRRTDYPFTHDWFRGKSFDTFGPMGPWLVPAECIPDPQALRLQLAVNGAPMQDGTTAAMIFSAAEQIAYLSRILTLKPGDLIATGTPTGVGMGRGVYLKPGDVMTATIEGIGTIENPVVAEAAAARAGAARGALAREGV